MEKAPVVVSSCFIDTFVTDCYGPYGPSSDGQIDKLSVGGGHQLAASIPFCYKWTLNAS